MKRLLAMAMGLLVILPMGFAAAKEQESDKFFKVRDTLTTQEQIKVDLQDNLGAIKAFGVIGWAEVAPEGATVDDLVIEEVFDRYLYVNPEIPMDPQVMTDGLDRKYHRFGWIAVTSVKGQPAIDIHLMEGGVIEKGYYIYGSSNGNASKRYAVIKKRAQKLQLTLTGRYVDVEGLAFLECLDREENGLALPLYEDSERFINTGYPVGLERLTELADLATLYTYNYLEQRYRETGEPQFGSVMHPGEIIDMGAFVPYRDPGAGWRHALLAIPAIAALGLWIRRRRKRAVTQD